jgi:hypothetical protein
MASASRVFRRAPQPSRHQSVRAGGVKNREYRQDNAHHDFETLTVAAEHC